MRLTKPTALLSAKSALTHGKTSATDPVGLSCGSDGCAVHRTVIFATATVSSDIPAPSDFPTAMLPMGAESFIERIFGELSDLGLREVDLVVSDQPEALRLMLGGGERWGITLRWHLAKTSATPYALLRHIATGAQRVLIGHADQWVSSRLLSSLQAQDGIAMDSGSGQWCGWACITGGDLGFANSATTTVTLAQEIGANRDLKRLQAESSDYAFAGTATQLLAVQEKALCSDADSVPAAWIRTPWGAMSPDASVSPKALMQGPVLVGPGCFVHANAHVGPCVVLARDVVIAADTDVSNSLVLADTFLDEGVKLHGAIANGNLIQSVSRGIRIDMTEGVDSLLQHGDLEPVALRLVGQAAAAAILVILLPWFIVDFCYRKLTMTPSRWSARWVVGARPSGPTTLLELRTAPAATTAYASRAWYFGGLLDVAQGRRCWFGVRPRSAAEWEALSADWQRIFARVSIGLFHAPAWADVDPRVQVEALAVADAYMAVRRSFWQRCLICFTIVLGYAKPKPHVISRLPAQALPDTQTYQGHRP
jgi:hypothetical protein